MTGNAAGFAWKGLIKKALYGVRAGTLTLTSPLLQLYRLKYRSIPTVKFEPIPEAQPLPSECYTDKLWYMSGETIRVFLITDQAVNFRIERLLRKSQFEAVFRTRLSAVEQPAIENAAENGCNWQETLAVQSAPEWPTGYYRIALHPDNGADISYFTFLLQQPGPKNRIAVIAPVSTWLAYNPYGGKSLYHNELDKENVYFASAARPNPALQYSDRSTLHALPIEANIFNWLNQQYGTDLYPDFALEQPELLKDYQVIVLAYHCEYFSAGMYQGLRKLILEQEKSLLALGGNQIYWKIKWHDHYTRVECRKNASDFSDGSKGGLWRHSSHPEEELLGVRFSESGTATYAPYQAVQPGHWLFSGTGIKAGELFGESGIDGRPICGDETDKSTLFSRFSTEVIARGLNAETALPNANYYRPGDPEWNGNGGGEIAFTSHSETHAVLSTGSIHSGSGLGADPVFTRLISNFIERYTT